MPDVLLRKGRSAHISRALELLNDIGRPPTGTNAYTLLTSEAGLKAALEKLTEKEPTERRIRLADTLEQTDAKRCAEAAGRHYVERSTRTVNADNTSHSYQRVEEYYTKPHEIRALADHTVVVRHCTNGYRKVRLLPL